MSGVPIERIIEEFNKKNGVKLKVESFTVDSYRLKVNFCSTGNRNVNNFDEEIVEFGNFLSIHSGIDYDLIRLYRLGNGRFVGVFCPDSDRMKEVVDFGFEPFDMLL
ncbi:MAG: hypothetical protein QMD82_01765 [bacterium]|nr:hypothetical protein [bacterium]